MKETCSCGASFEYTRPSGAWDPNHADKVYKWLLDWRKNHHHEFAPEPEGPPLIHESASFHERLEQPMSTENDIPFGFTRNETR